MRGAMEPTQKRIDAAVRWDGNNLEAIRDFVIQWPALVEKDGTRARVIIFAGLDNHAIKRMEPVLDEILEQGDGLFLDQGLLGVARGIVFEHEYPGQVIH
jgi:hypothetical protein